MPRRFFCLVSTSLAVNCNLRNGKAIELKGLRSKLIAASIFLLAASPKLTEVRAYAQTYSGPATVNTGAQSIDVAGSNVQSLTTMGAASQGIVITTGDKLPGTSTDSQSGTGHQGPAVPPAPGMPQVDAVGGLIPSVSGVTLTPDVPSPSADTHVLSSVTDASAVVTSPVTAPDFVAVPAVSAGSAMPDAPLPAPLTATASVSAPEVSQAVYLTTGTNSIFASGLGLDLSSSQATIAAPVSQPVTILVGGAMNSSGAVIGGTALTIQPGQLVTPSQYVALTQVVGQGSQSIVLTDSGVSQSGNLTLLANQTGALSSLVLPTNVTLSGVGFSVTNPFVVSGSTSILGSFFALQNSSSTSSILNFGNLTVTGLLSGDVSSVPALSLGTPAFSTGLFSSSGLTINTAGFLNNSGMISSPGFLTINSAGSFTNSGTVLASAGNLNLNSLSGNFVNSGMLTAPMGSVNVNTAAATLASNINFNNLAGRISARDNINFRASENSSNANVTVSGGDFLSSKLNVNAGLGTAEIHVNQLTGVLNTYGEAAHVSANTDTLSLGEQCLVGDPTYFNTGNIAISGNITVGEKLAIIASGNITNSGAGGYSITARNGLGVGQDITIIAGAAFTTAAAGGGVATVSGAPPLGAIPLVGTVNVTGGTATGGNITLTTGAGVSLIDASGSSGAGGNVTLIAFANTAGSGNGTILLPTTSNINTAGSGSSNGNITVAAGRSTGAAAVGIQLGSLTASGPTSTSAGNISVALAQPTVSVGGVTYDSSGNISNGGSFAFPLASGTTDQRIQIGGGAAQSIRSGGNVSISAGGAITLNLGAVNTQGGSFTATSNNFGESINLNAGSLATSGGSVLLSAGDTLTLSNGSLNTGSIVGNGGNISLLSDQDGDGAGNITAPTFTFSTNGVASAGNFFAENRSTVTSGKQISLGSLSMLGSTGGNAVVHGNGANLVLASITASAGGSVKLVASPSAAVAPPAQTITLNGSINTGGSSLAVVSNGSITSASAVAINTSGGSAFFAAGANGSLETAASPTSNIVVSGRSGVGGNIDLATNAITSLNTSGGNLTMVAAAPTAGSTANGRILLPAALTLLTSGGNVELVAEQRNTAGNSIQVAGGVNTVGSGVGNISVSTATPILPVTFTSATGALSGSVIGGATQAAGANIGTINAGTTSLTTVNVGRLDTASSINGSTGTLNVTAASGLLRVGALNTSGVTTFVNGAGGDITTIGSVLNSTGGISFQTSGLAANGGVITVNGAISKTGSGDLSLVTSGTGSASNIVLNQAVTESGAGNLVIQTSGANSDITIDSLITSDLGGNTVLTAGSSGSASIDLLAGSSLSAPNLTINTPALTLAAGASLVASAGDLQVSSNSVSRALTASMASPTATIQSTSGNVSFNTIAVPGAIAITGGSANGIISASGGAGVINFNGGTNAVAANANQLRGTVTGTGSTFTINSGLVGSQLNLGAINATGNIVLTSAGNIAVASDITTSGGNLTLTSSNVASGQIAFAANTDLLASNNVILNTPNLLLTGGNNTITASAGDVTLQSNRAGAALAVTLGAGAQINATAATGDIFFNPTAAGSITVTGGAVPAPTNGLLNAGNTVSLRGGAVALNVNQINGQVISNGTSSTTSIATANGDLRVGAYTSSGVTSFSANGVGADLITAGVINSGAGNLTLQAGSGADANVTINSAVTTTGTLNVISGSGSNSAITVANAVTATGASNNITTPSLVVNGTGAVIASTGNLQISSNAPTNALSVSLNGPNSLLRATLGNIALNAAPGSIVVNGGPLNGVLTANNGAGTVNFNGGLSNGVDVNVRQINGVVSGSGTPFNVSVAQASTLGDLRLGPITSNGDLTFVSPANIVVLDDLVSNSGNITLTSGGAAANSISFANNADLLANGNVNLTTPTLLLTGGNNRVTASNGDVGVQSNLAGNALQVTMGAGSQVNAAASSRDVFFNPTTAGNIVISGANGLLNAGNTVSFRGGTVSTTVNQINGAVVSNGATTSTAAIITSAGDLQIGPFTSDGTTSFTANGTNANLTVAGSVNTAGNLTLRSGTGLADVRVNNNVTASGVLTIVAGVAAGSDVTLSNTLVSGGSVTANTAVLNLGANSQLRATNTALTVDSNAPSNGLNVNLGANSTILGTTIVNFNAAGAANQGAIAVSGAPGSLVQAPTINYNVGANILNVNLGQLSGNNNVLSAVGNPTAVGFVSQSGSLNFSSAISTSNAAGNGGSVNIVASGGSINFAGLDLSANGGGIGGSGGSINVSASGGIINGGNIRSNGSAAGSGNGGTITLTSVGDISVRTLQSLAGVAGNGGSITSSSSNLSVIAIGPDGNSISTRATNGSGGVISINTTSSNPFIAGNPFPNGTASGIASNGSVNGGRVTVLSNGFTANSPISANGVTGAGGVVTLVANSIANANPTFTINAPVSAIGGIAGTGVVGIGAGAGQPLTVNVGAGSINAGQQLTIGNLNTVTGLPSGLPASLLTITPTPPAVLPSSPFNTPLITYNAVFPAPTPTPTPSNISITGAARGFDLAAFLLAQRPPQNPEILGLRIPTDLTPVFDQEQLTGVINQDNDELVRKNSVGSRVLIDGQVTYKSNFTKDEIAKLADEGIVLLGDTSGNSFGLEQGNMIFAPTQDIVVHAGEASVIVPAGAVVFVMKTLDDVAVFDLHQSKENAVNIVADKKLITLDPGRLVVLSKQSARDFERTVGAYRWIGYRNAKEEDINAELRAFGMDFSIPSALTNVIPLKNMLQSTSRQDRQTIDKVLKNSALLGELTNGSGPFRSGSDLSQ